MYITVDPYYSTQFYNECLEALKNNKVEFTEHIKIKPPFLWCIKLDKEPVLVNYDTLTKTDIRFLVNTVKPLRANEEYYYLRREDSNSTTGIAKYIENEPFQDMRKSNFGIFFDIKNREEGERLSKEYPGKIWFLGKYYANKHRVCFCTDKMILNYLNPAQILLKNDNEFKEVGSFEAEFNYRVFKNKDMLLKYTDTPYFENGTYNAVKIKPEESAKYII